MPSQSANTSISICDLVNYINANKGTKVFQGWTDEQIAFECYRSAQDNSMLFATDETSGYLVGVVLARKLLDGDTGEKVMSISAILTSRKGVMLEFYQHFLRMFPDYKLMQATRRKKKGGKRIVYYKNLKRFHQLLTHLS